MQEYNLDFNSFIHGNFINLEICDSLINVFNSNKKFQVPGGIHKNEKYLVDKKYKDSMDLDIDPTDSNFTDYKKELSKVLKNYCNKYDAINSLDYFTVTKNIVIQHYKKEGGFKQWHSERGSKLSQDRVLVFMTFLNDCKNGGTQFKYQNLTVPAKKGLTLIWPAEWTHTHKGQISKEEEKYIITGWFNFL
mgnify:FL=1